MVDLGTTYLGLKLKSPLLASSSPLTRELDNIRRMEDAGAAAIVMHSLFEEQIVNDPGAQAQEASPNSLRDALSNASVLAGIYMPEVTSYNQGPEGYLEQIRKAKAAVQIPIIASLNGVSLGAWTGYAARTEEAGADAVELNTYYLLADAEVTSAQVETMYCDLVKRVKSTLCIPLAVKLNSQFSALPNFARRLHLAGADGLVLFNRFYQPDFDLERLETMPAVALSNPQELLLRLHWVAMLSGHVRAYLAVTGGIHTAEDVLKAVAAGANVTMMTSALLKHGVGHFAKVLADLKEWMDKHRYESIGRIRGSMAIRSLFDPSAFERANYVRVLSSSGLGAAGQKTAR
ncbi:MAG TPA: dihydroorotate dehydrogenase-like protein [Terriglobia bacterium]|nr:dihydroorotate dehydrogenase-like protein [Terriglobia bacterium]